MKWLALQLCADAFLDVPGKVPKMLNIEGMAEYMSKEYADLAARDIIRAMSLSLQKKEDGFLAVRSARASRRAELLRAEVALLRMQGGGDAPPEAQLAERLRLAEADDLRPLFPASEAQRLQRQRQFVCFVAEQPGGSGGGAEAELARCLVFCRLRPSKPQDFEDEAFQLLTMMRRESGSRRSRSTAAAI